MTSFDRVARIYRWMEYLSFGPWLGRCRNAQLIRLTGARRARRAPRAPRALVLGDGDGRFLARLLAANANLTADVVDSSQAMLNLLDRRIRRSGRHARDRICLHHADALEWKPSGSYDLIVSHFFLDCFFPQQVEQLLLSVLAHTQPGTQWVVSEFAIPQSRIVALLCRGIVAVLYRAFGMLTGLRVRALPDYAGCLLRHGLVLTSERRFLAGLLCSQLWAVKQMPSEML